MNYTNEKDTRLKSKNSSLFSILPFILIAVVCVLHTSMVEPVYCFKNVMTNISVGGHTAVYPGTILSKDKTINFIKIFKNIEPKHFKIDIFMPNNTYFNNLLTKNDLERHFFNHPSFLFTHPNFIENNFNLSMQLSSRATLNFDFLSKTNVMDRKYSQYISKFLYVVEKNEHNQYLIKIDNNLHEEYFKNYYKNIYSSIANTQNSYNFY